MNESLERRLLYIDLPVLIHNILLEYALIGDRDEKILHIIAEEIRRTTNDEIRATFNMLNIKDHRPDNFEDITDTAI